MSVETQKNPNSDNTKTFNSEHHTLFVETIDEVKTPVDGMENTFTINPSHKKYTMYIDEFMERKRGLHSVLNELRKATSNDKLEIRVNSPGGYVHEGMLFYNLFREKFRNTTTTVLDAYGRSMGAMLFCMGDERIIYEDSEIMFHDYSGANWGKAGEQEAKLDFDRVRLRNFFKKIIVSTKFLTDDEFEKMIIGKDYYFDAKEMCIRGIATHVMFEGEKITAVEFLKK